MKDITIEKLIPELVTQADFDRIVALEVNCGLPDPYPPSLIAEILEVLDVFVCRANSEIVGFIMINEHGRYFGSSVYIVNLNVDSAFRGRGIAKRLIYTVCRYYLAHRLDGLISLDVTISNPAMQLYEKIGFQKTFLPSRNGKTDIVMAAPLKSILKTLENIL